MIQNPILILLVLIAVVVLASIWARKSRHSKLMNLLPTPVWCYIPPTLLTTAGILPMMSPVYDLIAHFVLPACLLLLLMTTDLKSLRQIGSLAVWTMLIATTSVLVGGIAVFFIFRTWIGPEAWNAIGTMAGSLIGGTLNALSIKSATGLSEETFTPVFIADLTVVYVWMTFLMIIASRQDWINQKLNVQRLKEPEQVVETESMIAPVFIPPGQALKMLFFGFTGAALLVWIGSHLPEAGGSLTHGTWIIILVTTAGLVLSHFSIVRNNAKPASTVGYFLLYLVLAATGAKANLLAILIAPVYLLIGTVWILIHAGLLLIFGRIFRIPVGMLATASQANLGGVASAPVVASIFDPRLIPAALILAILGNAAGNYLGLLLAFMLKPWSG